jgi:glycerol kinase
MRAEPSSVHARNESGAYRSRRTQAMAYGTAEVLSTMRDATGQGAQFDRLRVDGGATTNDWLMQFQAASSVFKSARTWSRHRAGAAGWLGAAGVWKDTHFFQRDTLRRSLRP